MTNTRLLARDEVPTELTWDLTLLYPSDDAMRADLDDTLLLADKLSGFAGHLNGAKELLAALNTHKQIETDLEKEYVYAFLRRDSDTTDATANALFGTAAKAATAIATKEAFLEPEILAIDEGALDGYFKQEPGLEEFRYELEQIRLQRGHVLTTSEEKLLSRLNRSLDSADEIYNTLNDADLNFGQVHNDEGNLVQLTHGNRSQFTESLKRPVRKEATLAYAKPYHDLRNTFAQTLNSFVGAQNAVAELRHYQSGRQAALAPHQIDEQVYDTLVKTVNDHLDLAHRWYRIKKDYLGLADFNQADINTPLAGDDVLKTTFAEGKQLTLDALSVLGDEYTAGLKEEFNHRWIDAAENSGKRSGGYQISVYKANPFILLNWTDKLYSTYVLAHESGHAMHSWFSQHHQPAQYADAPIFLAEVASTFNEQILTSYLLEKYQADKKVQLYVLEQAIDGFIGTIYRQTQFAEFEHTAYQTEQAGQALTADFLDQTSSALLKKYYGPDVALLDGTATQSWAYVPHFYMNYYVYQYATSWAASTSLASAVWQHKPGAKETYLNFLSAGGSAAPLEILKRAGVDATTSQYLEEALAVFERYLDRIEALLKN
ncbi:oligoendopeptidase F [Limosilactobacillus fermentum]|uniref:oligoendopeptidase F n=1 Tax=Limosilactobacillus fermentum TaxID=1613 RepID=UPI0020908436|nr:oligoendopeptidase F [Limosilactobacillus fermentum]UVF13702.1 oligoendopeptidase F [Limosilactobacillus fermentum]